MGMNIIINDIRTMMSYCATPSSTTTTNPKPTSQSPSPPSSTITPSALAYLRTHLPGIWKYELIYKTFFPHTMSVDFGKLELLWDVQCCHISELPQFIKDAESKALKLRLDLIRGVGCGGGGGGEEGAKVGKNGMG